jgi:hypothetical protein
MSTENLKITIIQTSEIKLPSTASEAPESELNKMAGEIIKDGWPKGKELGVKELKEGYEVHASHSWYRAGLIAGLTEIPCVIY